MMAATDGEILMRSRSINFDRPGRLGGGDWGCFGRGIFLEGKYHEISRGKGYLAILSFSKIDVQDASR